MKLTISIPDELYEKLKTCNKKDWPVEKTAADLLAAFPLDLRDRYLLLTPTERKELERILACPIYEAKELIKRVANRASVTIGHVRLSPTDAQMHRLAARAKANNKTPEQEANEVFQSIAANFFGHI